MNMITIHCFAQLPTNISVISLSVEKIGFLLPIYCFLHLCVYILYRLTDIHTLVLKLKTTCIIMHNCVNDCYTVLGVKKKTLLTN